MAYTGTMGENNIPLYKCECGQTFELPYDSVRCPCECHNAALERAKQLGLYCKDCGFSSLEPTTFNAHFHWRTHQIAVAKKK